MEEQDFPPSYLQVTVDLVYLWKIKYIAKEKKSAADRDGKKSKYQVLRF